jgi:hypothetical protein
MPVIIRLTDAGNVGSNISAYSTNKTASDQKPPQTKKQKKDEKVKKAKKDETDEKTKKTELGIASK